MTPVLEFPATGKQRATLTPNEKKLLPLLKKAVELTGKIYEQQQNDKYPGANFYASGVTKKEIESEAQNNPEILSPYTVVEKDETGGLVAIGYSEKYSKLLDPLVRILTDAAKICENKSFKNYLEILSSVLLNDDYKRADIAWLQIKDSNIDLLIGPYEDVLDKIFAVKRAYQAHVGIIDKEQSEEARKIRDILYTNIGEKPHRIIPPSIVDIQLEHNLYTSGLIANLQYTEQHLPSDTDTIQNNGLKILNYQSSMDYKFNKLLLPVFEAIFEEQFKASYSREQLEKGNYYHNLLQSIAQQLHEYKDSRNRLKELFPVFYDANGLISGVMHAKYLVLKGVMSQKELESLMIMDICWIFSEYVLSKTIKGRECFFKGDTIALDFLTKSGAILERDGISWPNFAKMFFEIENLSSIFSHLLEAGSYSEAQVFLHSYSTPEHFDAFKSRLSSLEKHS